MSAPVRPSYASTSLYVGDLSPEVSEAQLYELFNSVGPVASIRVCKDAGSRKSLGYAYVNYHSISDAERAIDTLNYTNIKGSICRIMWSQRDPTVRKSGNGNLFVKNLDRSVDNRMLHDTFSLFGNILSCKVVADENGKSKGYGFIHFELDEAAADAISKVNGMKIGTKEVYVGQFHKRSERVSGKTQNFTNLYCRSFPKEWTDTTIETVFGRFGEITSVWHTFDKQGRPFCCVNFANPESARQALTHLNGAKVNAQGVVTPSESTAKDAEAKGVDTAEEEMTLYVDRAQDKAERDAARNKEKLRGITQQKYEGVNLYIKNLSDSVDDSELRSMFEKYGTITSAKVMRDEDGHSKGFGFVCFTASEEATKAIAEMHLKVYESKPLYVGLAELKDRRQARLQNHFRGGRQQQQPPPMPQSYANYFPTQQSSQPIVWTAPYPPPQVPWNKMYTSAGVMMPQPMVYNSMRTSRPLTTAQGARGPIPVPAIQKQMLGEKLFPLVAKYQPALAGKITGMMLDMDEQELIMLIQSESELKAKIDEALKVLQQASNQ